MPALLERQKTTFSTPGQLGDQGVFTSDQQPTFREGVSVFRYVVPSSTQVTLENIVVTAIPGVRTTPGAGRSSAGVLKFQLNGADVGEWRLIQDELPSITAGDETVAPCGMAQRFDFHDGVLVLEGETFAVTVTPQSATAGNVYAVTVWGEEDGSTTSVIAKGVLVPSATTANQSVVSITPSGFKLNVKGVSVDVVKGPSVCGYAMLVINGGLVCDLGLIGLSDTEPTVGLQANRGLGVPLSGLDLWPGDVVEVLFAAWLDRGDVVDVQLAGNTAAIGGGGGSSEHSFAFVG